MFMQLRNNRNKFNRNFFTPIFFSRYASVDAHPHSSINDATEPPQEMYIFNFSVKKKCFQVSLWWQTLGTLEEKLNGNCENLLRDFI